MRVASADDREIPFVRDRLDPSPVFGVFAVDLDRIEVSVTLPKGTVSERVSNDRSAVVFVREIDRLGRFQFARTGSRRG